VRRSPVIDGEGEHTIKVANYICTYLFIQVENHFGIRIRAEPVTAFKVSTQFPEVVDLAVEDDPDRLILVGHGLVPAIGQVDDTETPVAQSDLFLGEEADSHIVRPPMGKGLRHPLHQRLMAETHNPTDTAHIPC
jgi:hypothetical protein